MKESSLRPLCGDPSRGGGGGGGVRMIEMWEELLIDYEAIIDRGLREEGLCLLFSK